MDPHINTETGETVNSRSPRFTQWAAFLVFSTIVLGSAVQVKNGSEPVTSSSKYVVACSAVTFVFTAVIVAGHFHPVATTIFVGTKVEGVVIIVLVALWTFIVALNSDADKNLAPVGVATGSVQNANLYYFSWAGFITSILIVVSFLSDAFGLDMVGNVRNRAARLQWWAGLLAASIIVMGSAARVLQTDCHNPSSDVNYTVKYCRKTKWGIAAGTLGTAFCLLVISTKVFKYTATAAATPFMLEMGTSFILTIMNAFVVGYLTSAGGPGSATGNLYYFSWAMFLISGVLASECFSENAHPAAAGDALNGENGTRTTTNGSAYNNNDRGDIEVETFDDNI